MSYVDTVLMPGERVIYRGQLHWIIYTFGLIVTTFGWILAIMGPHRIFSMIGAEPPQLIQSVFRLIVGAIVLFGCFSLLMAFIRQTTTELAVTNHRVLAKVGWMSRETFELFLAKIEGANIEQRMWGRIFDYGCVHVHGTGGGSSPIDLICHPRAFQLAIVEQIELVQSRGSAAVNPASAVNG